MKQFDKILDTVMRFLLALSMFALLAGGTWQIFTRMIPAGPVHRYRRIPALCSDLGFPDRFRLLLLPR